MPQTAEKLTIYNETFKGDNNIHYVGKALAVYPQSAILVF